MAVNRDTQSHWRAEPRQRPGEFTRPLTRLGSPRKSVALRLVPRLTEADHESQSHRQPAPARQPIAPAGVKALPPVDRDVFHDHGADALRTRPILPRNGD